MQQKELEQLKNSIYILGQELADQQQRLDKGMYILCIIFITFIPTVAEQQDLVVLQSEVKEKGMKY